MGISWFVLSVLTCMNMEKKKDEWKTREREPKRTIVLKEKVKRMKRIDRCYNINKLADEAEKMAKCFQNRTWPKEM